MSNSAGSARNRGNRYRLIPFEELERERQLLAHKIINFLEIYDHPDSWDISCSRYALWEIIKRVDQRDAYYSYFHDFDINEKKIACLVAYWILKFRPLTVRFNEELLPEFSERKRADEINEAFAVYVLLSGLKIYNDTLSIKTAVNFPYYETLMYSFRYRNISIDAMVLLSESIVTETFNQKDTDVV